MEKRIEEILKHCSGVDVSGMSYEDWLEKRKSSIGGSDAGAIMGYVGKWGSPLTVFLVKKGLYIPPKEMSPAAKRGKKLEPVVRDDIIEDYPGITVEKIPYMLYHPEYPFISANLDGVISCPAGTVIDGKAIEGIGGLEIKTSKSGYGYGDNEIPDGHYCQVQHYMAVTGLGWFVLAVYFMEDEYEETRYYVVCRNDEFIDMLIKKEAEFWRKHMETGEWPAAIGIDAEEEMVTGMFTGGDTIVFDESEREFCRKYAEAHQKEKEAKDEKDRCSVEIKAAIVRKQSGGKEKKISAMAGKYSVSWSRFERSDIDRDALRKAGLYDQFVKKSETGRLTVSEKKGA